MEEKIKTKREKDHEYYEKNKEKIKLRVKKYAEENKEIIKIKQKLAYERRKEKNKGNEKFTVYLRTNKANGKQYVGQTKDFKSRESDWKCLSINYANKVITEERKEFGLENFDSIILAEVDTREEAWELERKYIKEFNTKFPNGYNMSDGGKGANGTEAWNKGIKGCFSEETIQKMSDARKGKEPWNKNFIGCYSEETIQKMSETRKGKPNLALSKEIYQYTLDGELVKIWQTVSECRRAGYIHACDVANGKRNFCNGFVFKYEDK